MRSRAFNSIEEWISHTAESCVRISETRLQLPREEPYVAGHNIWIGNHPGSLLGLQISHRNGAPHFLIFVADPRTVRLCVNRF